MSLDILTLTEVKDLLGIPSSYTTDDQKIMRLIPMATRRLEAYLRRYIIEREAIEYHYGGEPHWWLSNYPITSMDSIVDPAANEITTADYKLEAEKGLVICTTGVFTTPYDADGRVSRWTVTYTGGLFDDADAVGEEFKDALALLLIERFERPEPGVTSRKMGDLSVTYRTPGSGELVPVEVQALVGGYVSHYV